MRTYSSGDMAKLFCKECDGCGDCCRCMGDTIELDPYDAFQLTYGLRKDFASLIGPVVGLHENGGMVLPYMQTRPIPEEEQKARGMHFEDGQEPEECVFLSADGRCQIHGFRPGICRLFRWEGSTRRTAGVSAISWWRRSPAITRRRRCV